MKQELAQVRRELTSRDIDLEQAGYDPMSAQESLSRVREERSRLEEEKTSLVAEVSQLREAASQLQGEKAKLLGQESQLQEKASRLQGESEELRVRESLTIMEKAQAEMDALAFEEQFDALRKRVASLLEQNAQSTLERQDLRLAVQQLEEDARLHERDAQMLEEEASGAKLEKETAESAVFKLKGEVEALRKQVTSLQEQNTQSLRQELKLQLDVEKLTKDHGLARDRLAGELCDAKALAGEAKVRCEDLERSIAGKDQVLEGKCRQIEQLRETSERQAAELARFAGVVDAQVQHASELMRLMSLGDESDVWRAVVERAFADQTLSPVEHAQPDPWRVTTSWCTDKALDVRPEDRSLHAVAIDILSILHQGSTGVANLLSRLRALQDALVESTSILAPVAEMLLDAFTCAATDQRVHFMHRLLMCQVAALLASGNEQRVTELERAVEAADPRVTGLLGAFQAWDSDCTVEFQPGEFLEYPHEGLALVGFYGDPAGILTISFQNRELWWVDASRIVYDNGLMLSPPMTASIHLPVDTADRVMWATSHVPR
ncbi:hypothetical protein ACJZ2D_016247 [Fusarium nematophilum]